MIFRTATSNDIPGVLTLQEKYLLTNTPVEKRENGFVTTPFTTAQIENVIALDGLFVVEKDQKIIAYAFAASWDYFSQWAIFPYMVSRMPQISFGDEKITPQNSFQYGPICIDEAYRGSGVFQKLFETVRKGMSERYPIGATFINKLNKRSFEAHTKKLDLVVVDEFEFNNNKFYGLAFKTNRSN